MTPLYSSQAIRKIEAFAAASGADELALMQKAGNAAYRFLETHWPEARCIIVCCGKGKNAGDGFVLARAAKLAGRDPIIYLTKSIDQLSGITREVAEQAQAAGVSMIPADQAESWEADLIVDALLGTGLRGEVDEFFANLIHAMNEATAPIFSLDISSGLNTDTGDVLGVAVKADATITFIALKPGLYTGKGPEHSGSVTLEQLGIDMAILKKVDSVADLMSWEEVSPILPRRKRDAHKGNYGHVLVIGGDYGMGGAVRMASESALRVGSGLVSVATRPEHVSVVNASRPEIMCHTVNNGFDLIPLLEKATVVVIGPGLGKSDWAQSLLEMVLKTNLPKLIDADGLNLLSQMKSTSDNWILTPHPGEASRLLETSCYEVQDDRLQAAANIQKMYGGVVVLKGVGTIIQAKNQHPIICPAGNPGMATAGMGDVLSGVIGGLLAQGMSLHDAAKAGVFVHAKAADLAAEQGGERGLLATDLMNYLRELVN